MQMELYILPLWSTSLFMGAGFFWAIVVFRRGFSRWDEDQIVSGWGGVARPGWLVAVCARRVAVDPAALVNNFRNALA